MKKTTIFRGKKQCLITKEPANPKRPKKKENGDMDWACCEELVELDDVQLATVVGGSPVYRGPVMVGGWGPDEFIVQGTELWLSGWGPESIWDVRSRRWEYWK